METCRNACFPRSIDQDYNVASNVSWKDGSINCIKAKLIYVELTKTDSVLEHVNKCWDIFLNHKEWQNTIFFVWHESMEPK